MTNVLESSVKFILRSFDPEFLIKEVEQCPFRIS